MAIDTIGTNAIANDAVTAAKIPDGAVDADLGAVHSVISVKGTVVSTIATTLTIEIGGKFASSVNVKYYEGSTLLATDSSRTVTNGTLTSTVPSAVYGQSVGDIIAIKIESGSSLSANSVDKTVVTAPSGGTITTSGDYRIHSFTSSGTFTIAANTLLKNIEYLIIGGGGGAGHHVDGTYYSDSSGGGGAGGYRCSVPGENSGGGLSAEAPIPFMTPGAYNCQVGAGGAKGTNTSGTAAAGLPSVFGGATIPTSSVGTTNAEYAFFFGSAEHAASALSTAGSLPVHSFGGGGSPNCAITNNGPYKQGGAGGSGGGNSHGYNSTIVNSTAATGQGYIGGSMGDSTCQLGTAGGGAGGQPANVNNSNRNTTATLNGGVGVSSSITGSAVLRGGGGAAGGSAQGGSSSTAGTAVAGGGNGGNSSVAGSNGTANTGGGGGGAGSTGGQQELASGNGGSGIIIIRYKLNEVDNFL